MERQEVKAQRESRYEKGKRKVGLKGEERGGVREGEGERRRGGRGAEEGGRRGRRGQGKEGGGGGAAERE